MPVLELNAADQYVVVTGDTPLLEVYAALPEGLVPPFPPVELPGGVGGLVLRGGFAQTFFFPAEVLGLVLGTPDGREVRAGGRVVKNVQGYDLVRPVVGSFGLLGEVREAVLRLRPARARLLVRRAGRFEDLAEPLPRFVWQEEGWVYAFAYGHPREVERFAEAFGGEVLAEGPDYTPRFPNGMGVGEGPLRDQRFAWRDGGERPPVPKVFWRLVRALGG